MKYIYSTEPVSLGEAVASGFGGKPIMSTVLVANGEGYQPIFEVKHELAGSVVELLNAGFHAMQEESELTVYKGRLKEAEYLVRTLRDELAAVTQDRGEKANGEEPAEAQSDEVYNAEQPAEEPSMAFKLGERIAETFVDSILEAVVKATGPRTQ